MQEIFCNFCIYYQIRSKSQQYNLKWIKKVSMHLVFLQYFCENKWHVNKICK